ncbi:hypothetical protein G9U51_15490 [Calidifontibacter sp. DB0510]|uniref:DUF2384 domain-containing protein n=1 Tax=Metallococcus carri TaxID=1656884 RepID=A0A967B396_9MICO|nr:hypothetical protein [Metallococcus carri]NHN57174.1 hypothetical protein [Metallococcus carri]NOP38023.1 hypothetical protein [Calidifontibacter sp. DB2511S]
MTEAIRVWALDKRAAQAVRASESVDASTPLDPGDNESMIVMELPASVVRRHPELLNPQRSVALDVFDSLTRDVGRYGRGMHAQTRLAADRVRAIDEEFGLLDSAAVAELSGSTASNAAATASRWMRAGKVFAVRLGGRTLFPAFQFDELGAPLPLVRDVLTAYGPATGTALALWFTAPNAYLAGDRPVDRLGDRDEVVAAAKQAQQASV